MLSRCLGLVHFVAPTEDDWLPVQLLNPLDGALNEFLFAGNTNMAQEGTGAILLKNISIRLSQGPVLGCEYELEALRLAEQVTLGLFGDM